MASFPIIVLMVLACCVIFCPLLGGVIYLVTRDKKFSITAAACPAVPGIAVIASNVHLLF